MCRTAFLKHAVFITGAQIVILLCSAPSLPKIAALTIATTTKATATATATEKASGDGLGIQRSLRLPNSSYPLHYHLHIISNVHLEDFNYTGNATIDIQMLENSREIVLHAKELSDFKISIRNSISLKMMTGLRHSYDARASFLIIHIEDSVEEIFAAGQRYRVEILYSAVLQTKTNGLYWLTYNDANNRTVYFAATQFEPTSARLALPCYDEPAFKANFTIRITHGNNYTAISNMPVDSVEDHRDRNLTTTTFLPTPPISTYLVAFVISDFEYIAEEYRGVTQRIFTPPNSADKGYQALKNAVRTVAALEDYFGINYPLVKLDHIALKKNYGAAMENWGLITYREDALIHWNEGDVHKKLQDVLTQNHEIAHQWFGDLVSPEWWTYAWMNEGFATYFSYVVTDLLYPEFKAMDFFLTDIAERAYSYSYINVRPMTFYVEKESEIYNVFDIISYQRAACVIKMFHHAFSRKTFVNGISRFLRKFQYGVANEEKLFNSLQSAVLDDAAISRQLWNTSVPEIMLSWTHSEWIPIVTIVRNYMDNTITIRQKSKDIHSQKEYWWIPLNFATTLSPEFENTRVEYFMPPKPEVTISLTEIGITLAADDWLLANKQQTGFYHVLYDDNNLRAIACQLQKNHSAIHPLNRGALFQDLAPLIESNEIQSVDVVFDLLRYMRKEKDMIPWNLVADTIEFFENNLFGTSSHDPYKRFVRNLIEPIFNDLFNQPMDYMNLTNTELLAKQKVLRMACVVDLPECLKYTHDLAIDYIFQRRKFDTHANYYAINDNIMCLGLKYLNNDDFNNILNLLSNLERDSVFYDNIIYALRCTQSPKHLNQYLQMLLGGNSTHSIMSDRDSMMYLFYVYKSNMAARSVVWHFFEQNYKILNRSPFFVEHFNRMAEYVPSRFHKNFFALREALAHELKSSGKDANEVLINTDSQRIGKKVKISEIFVEKFAEQIDDWLMRNEHLSASVPGASVSAASLSVASNSAANCLSFPFRAAERFFHKLLTLSPQIGPYL